MFSADLVIEVLKVIQLIIIRLFCLDRFDQMNCLILAADSWWLLSLQKIVSFSFVFFLCGSHLCLQSVFDWCFALLYRSVTLFLAAALGKGLDCAGVVCGDFSPGCLDFCEECSEWHGPSSPYILVHGMLAAFLDSPVGLLSAGVLCHVSWRITAGITSQLQWWPLLFRLQHPQLFPSVHVTYSFQ